MQYLSKLNFKASERDIRWVITVPAIWSEEAKGLMKQWARQADMWNPSIDGHQLMITLEPECASLSMMLEVYNNATGLQFNIGDCYLMLDLGAGTADMVCHEVTGPFQVKEIVSPFGGPWGSSAIDSDVITLFQCLFGEGNMKQFQNLYPQCYLQFKQRFSKIQKKKDIAIHRIEIPFEFDEFMQSKFTNNLQELVADFEYLGQSGYEYDQEYLSIPCTLWTTLFDLRIDPIIKQINEVLLKNEKNLKGRLKYICLVGGFSESRHLQDKLKKHFERQFKFVIPQRPLLSVIEGAAQLDKTPPLFVTSRISKLTYGIGASWTLEQARSHPNINVDHINKHKYTCNIDSQEYVDCCFVVFVNKADTIKAEQVIELTFSKPNQLEKNGYVSVYCSNKRNPGVITGCKLLGEIAIPLPEDFDSVQDKLTVRFYLGETVIRVTVKTKANECTENELVIKYELGSDQSEIEQK
ncbi:hypothetical protein RFI_12667, partial [Reticulomyxa filosa]